MRRYKAMSERSHSLQRVQTSGLSSLFAHTRQTRQAAALTRVRRRPVSQDSQLPTGKADQAPSSDRVATHTPGARNSPLPRSTINSGNA